VNKFWSLLRRAWSALTSSDSAATWDKTARMEDMCLDCLNWTAEINILLVCLDICKKDPSPAKS